MKEFTPRAYINIDKSNGDFIVKWKTDNSEVEETWSRGASNISFVRAAMRDDTYEGRTNQKFIFVFRDNDDPEQRELWLDTSSTVFSHGLMSKLVSLPVPTDSFEVSAFRPKDKQYIIAMVQQGVDRIPPFFTKEDTEGMSFDERDEQTKEKFGLWLSEHFGERLVYAGLDKQPKALWPKSAASSPDIAPVSKASSEPLYTAKTFMQEVFSAGVDPVGINVKAFSFDSEDTAKTAAKLLAQYQDLWQAAKAAKVTALWVSDMKSSTKDATVLAMVANIAEVLPVDDDLPF